MFLFSMYKYKINCIVIAASKLVPLCFTSASNIHAQRQEIIQITSGSRELDNILEGDISPLSIMQNDVSHVVNY